MNDGVLGILVLGALVGGVTGFYRMVLRRTWVRSFLWMLATLLVFVAVVFVESVAKGR